MLAKFYIEIDLIYIILLLCLMFQTIKSNFTKIDKTHFLVLLICSTLFVLSDFIWIFNDDFISYSVFGDYAYTIGEIGNNLNIILSGMTSLSWLFFSESIQRKTVFSNKKLLYLALVPELILIILCATNISTNILFVIDDSLTYIRKVGGYAFQVVVAYGYLGVAGALSLARAKRAVTVQEKNTSLSAASFLIAPSISCIFQLIFYDMPIMFIGVIISLLNIYLTLQRQLVLNDALTGLNNRSRLDQKINLRIKNLKDENDFWFIILDADDFKHINDTYGHVEGDKALILIADALRQGCDDDDFICRYGGDEFVILHNTLKGDNCDSLINNINGILNKNNLAYKLGVSFGCAKYDDSINNWLELVKKADEQLYLVKKQKKKG